MDEVKFKKYTIKKDGTVISPSGHTVGYTLNKRYKMVAIDGCIYRLDWLIACLFGGLDPNEERYYIRHINGDNSDCSVDNLKIFTGDDAKAEKSRVYIEAFRNIDKPNRSEKEIYLIDLDSSTYYITTIREAANRLHKSKSTILSKLDGSKIDGRWRITDSFGDVWRPFRRFKRLVI